MEIWYKRVSRLLTVLAVFYVVLAVVGLFAEVGIWSFIIPIVAILSVMLLLLLPMVFNGKLEEFCREWKKL